jgi:hypothetical protein
LSVVIIAGHLEVDGALAERLVSEGDVVGLVVEDDGMVDHIVAPGAHVAQGSRADDDLIERAATHARTIVVFYTPAHSNYDQILEAAVTAAQRLKDVRLVVWGPDLPAPALQGLKASGLDYVAIKTGRLRSRLRKTVPVSAVVEALDAADDLAGDDVKLEVDLTRPSGWSSLGLTAPA